MSRVLLVDDDALLTELLTEYLTAEGSTSTAFLTAKRRSRNSDRTIRCRRIRLHDA